MATKEKPVIVKTYGKEQTFPSRKVAIAEVKEWCACSEGSEQSRYCNVLCDLLDGKDYCTDGE